MLIAVCGHQPSFDTFQLTSPRIYFDNSKQTLDHTYYCELASMYSLWKDYPNEDIVGLEHYRRFFVNNDNQILTKEEIKSILQTSDIIMARNKLTCNVMTWIAKETHNLLESFNGKTRILMYKWWMYVRDNYSHEFVDTMISRMMTHNTYLGCNMFIGKKEVLDKYCEWLFPLMFSFFTDVMNSEYESRIFGYLSEYVFGYWLRWNHFNVATLDFKKIS